MMTEPECMGTSMPPHLSFKHTQNCHSNTILSISIWVYCFNNTGQNSDVCNPTSIINCLLVNNDKYWHEVCFYICCIMFV